MTFKVPDDPFLKDAEGAARFCRELLSRRLKRKYQTVDYDAAIRWSARCAAHWVQHSKAWSALSSPSPAPTGEK
jgi:hypothetical protein